MGTKFINPILTSIYIPQNRSTDFYRVVNFYLKTMEEEVQKEVH